SKLNDFYKAKEELTQRLQRIPTDEEICGELSITDKQLKDNHETVHSLASVSLDEVLFQDSDSDASLIDLLENEEEEGIEDKLLAKEQLVYLDQAIKKLNDREQTILQLYYTEELPLKEIA